MQELNKYYNHYRYMVVSLMFLLSIFSDALVMQFNLYQRQGINFIGKYGNKNTPFSKELYNKFHNVMDKLDKLGYSQPTAEEYNANIAKGKRLMQESHE